MKAAGYSSKNYSWLIPLGVALYWFGLFFLSHFTGKPISEWLVHLGVPALEQSFSDARLVGLWCDESKAGRDPYHHPPIDEAGRILRMNYPPLYFGFGWLGLGKETAFIYGILLAAAFALSATWIAGPCSKGCACIWIALLCSPVSVFACERGNFDILVFFFLSLSVAVRSYAFLAGGLILLAATFKLFPIAGLAAVFARSGRGVFAALAGLACFGVYLFFIQDWLPFIFGSLSSNVSCAFGSAVVPNQLGRPEWAILFKIALLIGGSCLGILGLVRADVSEPVCHERASFAAWIGVPIFGLLILSGVQFDYKLIFLFFAVPAALELASGLNATLRAGARIWIGLFFCYSYWMFFSGEACLRNFLLKQAVASLLFLLSCFLFGAIARPVALRLFNPSFARISKK
jgi:hypothetical protein